MKVIYTRPRSGKQFECEVLSRGEHKSIIRHKEGKYIVEVSVFNKHLTIIEE